MKATDLMIGDWVKCTDPRCEGHQVDLIDHGNEEVGLDGEIDNFENIIPIPLTPEIFEKSGFTLNEEENPIFTIRVYSLDADDVAVIQRPKGGWKFMYGKATDNQQNLFFGDGTFVCMPIQYVHELQHALRLCGIDKEITL